MIDPIDTPALDPPPELPSPPAPGFPTWKQSIILIVSGAVLAFTTCVGYVMFAMSNPSNAAAEGWAGLAIAVVAVGVIGAIVGVLMLLWLIGRALFGRPTR